MTDVLTPNAKQQFFDNNGNPAVNHRLFTYSAGTSTKRSTHTSSSGAVNNPNPTVLNFRGEADIWIPPNVAYKYVLAPPGTDDPPTSSIWTVDNIVSSQLITLYGGLATGTDNYSLTFTSNFTAYQDGIIIYWIPSNTNTTVSTLNVNGLGAVSIRDSSGVPLLAGRIIANQIAAVMYRGGLFYLLSVGYVTGSFTGTLTGFVANPTGTVLYKIFGGICTLYISSNITGTSNATTMSMTGVPTVCRPGAQVDVPCLDMTDNGVSVAGFAGVSPGGSIVLGKYGVSGANVVPAVWTNAGTKGLNTGWTITYPL